MNRTIIIVIVVVLLVGVISSQSMYILKESHQAVVTQFGKPVHVVTEAGLHFKTPFMQKVNRLEKRLLPWDGDRENITTGDKKQIFIDVWARWRIVEAQEFFESFTTETRGQRFLDDIVDSAVRDVVARNNLIEVVRSSDRELLYEEGAPPTKEVEKIETGRAEMEREMTRVANEALAGRASGILLTEVHIKRVNYIESVRQTVYGRMTAERMQIAQLFESQAEEQRNRILGETQKELERIRGEERKRSAEIRGEADARVISISAGAYSQSPDFYMFLRRLEAFKAALKEDTRLVLTTNNDLLRSLLSLPEEPQP